MEDHADISESFSKILDSIGKMWYKLFRNDCNKNHSVDIMLFTNASSFFIKKVFP